MGYWCDLSIRQAVQFILKSWNEVLEASILSAWHPLLGVLESEATAPSITSGRALIWR